MQRVYSNPLHCCWLQISTQNLFSKIWCRKKDSNKERLLPREEYDFFFLNWIKTSIVLIFSFHCISMYCLGCHNYSSQSLFTDKKQFVKWQLYIKRQFLQWQVHLETISESGKQIIFHYDMPPLQYVNVCPCVSSVCDSVDEWNRVIKDLNLTRQQNVFFVYPVNAAFLSMNLQLIGMSSLLYSGPSWSCKLRLSRRQSISVWYT